uniref:Uncharacterized protein n=1 Tax=Rhizophagus irregularis (strain DAOM 181602 / DAOM 197198 / MUCL 43194) TaxID=747089 RepID=U9UKD7_RHIID
MILEQWLFLRFPNQTEQSLNWFLIFIENKKCEGEDHESSIIILAQISISKISVVEIFRLCIYDDIVFRRLRAIIDRDLDNAIKICYRTEECNPNEPSDKINKSTSKLSPIKSKVKQTKETEISRRNTGRRKLLHNLNYIIYHLGKMIHYSTIVDISI